MMESMYAALNSAWWHLTEWINSAQTLHNLFLDNFLSHERLQIFCNALWVRHCVVWLVFEIAATLQPCFEVSDAMQCLIVYLAAVELSCCLLKKLSWRHIWQEATSVQQQLQHTAEPAYSTWRCTLAWPDEMTHACRTVLVSGGLAYVQRKSSWAGELAEREKVRAFSGTAEGTWIFDYKWSLSINDCNRCILFADSAFVDNGYDEK